MSQYITNDTPEAHKELFELVHAYEDAQQLLDTAIKNIDAKLYKPDNSGFDSAESIAAFKKARPYALDADNEVLTDKRKLKEASKHLDNWLTPFIVSKLNSSQNEFVLCGHYAEGVIIIRTENSYGILHCNGSGTIKEQLSSYLRKL